MKYNTYVSHIRGLTFSTKHRRCTSTHDIECALHGATGARMDNCPIVQSNKQVTPFISQIVYPARIHFRGTLEYSIQTRDEAQLQNTRSQDV